MFCHILVGNLWEKSVARTVRNSKIDTRSARARLAEKKAGYWVSVSPGCSLGYRKGRTGGAWVAKFVSGKRRIETTLGSADDIRDADNMLSLSYVQAQERARAWFLTQTRSLFGHPTPATDYTVERCTEDYLVELARRGTKSIDDAKSRVRADIQPALGHILVPRLSADMIRTWHADLAQRTKRIRSPRGAAARFQATVPSPEATRKRRATANRTLTVLKAALNFAFKESRIASDEGWRRVRPFRSVDAVRLRYLTASECERLLNAASVEFKPLVQGALATGCRYSELTSLVTSDFDEAAGVVRVKTSKAGHPRYVVLRTEGVAFFREQTAGRRPHELVFSRSQGRQWGKSHQIRPLAHASRTANLEDGVTFHVLRHTYASHLAMAGVPIRVISENLGHADTRMTEKHYAHLAKSYVADELRSAKISLPI